MNENTKTTVLQKLIAILLSMLFLLILLPSTITVPLELVLFDNENYYDSLEERQLLGKAKELVAKIFVDNLYAEKEGYILPAVFINSDALKQAFVDIIPDEWVKSQLHNIIDSSIAYFNFRSPLAEITIDISTIKSEALVQSSMISNAIYNSLPYCNKQQEQIFQKNEIGILDIPACKPEEIHEDTSRILIKQTTEDFINAIPNIYLVGSFDLGAIQYDTSIFSNFFYEYTITRWLIRLLPVFALILLISIALILKTDKKLMINWISKLLSFFSIINLIVLLIVLIGFDQFSAILFESLLSKFISNWGAIVFTIFRNVGMQSILWIAMINTSLLLLGILMFFLSRMIKATKNEEQEQISFDDVLEAKKELIENKE